MKQDPKLPRLAIFTSLFTPIFSSQFPFTSSSSYTHIAYLRVHSTPFSSTFEFLAEERHGQQSIIIATPSFAGNAAHGEISFQDYFATGVLNGYSLAPLTSYPPSESLSLHLQRLSMHFHNLSAGLWILKLAFSTGNISINTRNASRTRNFFCFSYFSIYSPGIRVL